MCTENPPLQYKKRSKFIKDLARALIQPQIDRRSTLSVLKINLKMSWQKFASKISTEDQPDAEPRHKKKEIGETAALPNVCL